MEKYYKLDGSESKFASMREAMEYLESLKAEKAVKFIGGQITGYNEEGKLVEVTDITGMMSGKVRIGKTYNVESMSAERLKKIRRQKK